MSKDSIVTAAQELKAAHLRADALGGGHQADVARAYAALLDAVGDIDEPAEITARRAELDQMSAVAAEESEAK